MSEPLTLTLRPGHELTAGERAAILALCARAYQEDLAPIFATFTDPIHVLGTLGDTLVSHALWVTRWLQCAPHPPLRTAYVEAVATEPTLQGRGYAGALMRFLAEQIVDYELGALGPAQLGLYTRLGWELWQGPLFTRTTQGLEPAPGERVMVLRLPNTPPLDLTAPISAEWRPGELW